MQDRYLKFILIMPCLVILVAVTIYPTIFTLLLSFREWSLIKSPQPGAFVGIHNYARAFGDPRFLNSIKVTGIFTLASVLSSLALGLGIALLLSKETKFKRVLRTVLILPFAISPVLVGVSWRFMFNPKFGLFDYLFDVIAPPLRDVVWLGNPVLAMAALVIADIWQWTPFIALILLGGLTSIPIEAIDAAKVDGASDSQILVHVILPLLKPVIVVALLLKTMFSLKMFDQVFMLTEGGPGETTETLTFYVFRTGFTFFDMGYASALSYLLVIALIFIATVYTRFLFREAR